MSNYRMLPKEGTCTFHKIVHGRKWVGRVYQHADGSWRGAINKVELSNERSAVLAFEQAVSKHLGYKDVNHLNEHNRQVRAHRKVQKARAQYAFNEMMRGNFNALDDFLGLTKEKQD